MPCRTLFEDNPLHRRPVNQSYTVLLLLIPLQTTTKIVLCDRNEPDGGTTTAPSIPPFTPLAPHRRIISLRRA